VADPILRGGNFEAFASDVFSGVLALAPITDTVMVPPAGEGVCFTGLTFTWSPGAAVLPAMAMIELQESLDGGAVWMGICSLLLPVPGTLDIGGDGRPIAVSPTNAIGTVRGIVRYRLAGRSTAVGATRFTAACRGYSCL
jgi:hypothetical protein